MRLIDADALMEKLNGIWDCNDMTFTPVDGCCIDADCKSCRWRETIEYVKRLVQNQTTASPWHRVKDEPPKVGQNVLTMDVNEDMETATYDGDGFEDSYGFYVTDVLYWMPIEPPGEETDEP